MKRICLVFLFLSIAVPFASAKNKHSDAEYTDGVLVSFRTIVTGSDCSSSGKVAGSLSDSGNVEGKTQSSGSCSNNTAQIYTVKIGENTFEIEPLPVSWNKAHALEKKLPGYKFKVRTEKGKFLIKIDDRETGFEIRSAN